MDGPFDSDPSWRPRLIRFGALFLSMFCVRSAHPNAFQVSGIFENTIYNKQFEEVVVSGTFEVFVDACKWRIRTHRTDESLDYVEAGSADGHQIFLLASHTNATRRSILQEPNMVNPPLGFAELTVGEVPHYNISEQISILWLAYGSGCYFGTRTNNQIEPVHWFGDRYFFNRRLTLPGDWITHPNIPRLPMHVVYHNDGFTRALDRVNQTGRVTPNAGPYSKGYTNAVYEVQEFRDVGRFVLPTKFTLKTFRPRPDGAAATDLIPQRWFSFIATNLQAISTPGEFIPAIPGLVLVQDHRMPGDNNLNVYSYSVSNRWPSIEAILGNSRIVRSSASPPSLELQSKSQPIARAIVLTFLLLSLALVVLLIKNRNKMKEPT